MVHNSVHCTRGQGSGSTKVHFTQLTELGADLTKAGRLVGLADCYAVIELADNATFLVAVNRIAAFR